MICSSCKKEIPDGVCYCSLCGYKQATETENKDSASFLCHKCGGKIPLDSLFCPKCGERVCDSHDKKRIENIEQHNSYDLGDCIVEKKPKTIKEQIQNNPKMMVGMGCILVILVVSIVVFLSIKQDLNDKKSLSEVHSKELDAKESNIKEDLYLDKSNSEKDDKTHTEEKLNKYISQKGLTSQERAYKDIEFYEREQAEYDLATNISEDDYSEFASTDKNKADYELMTSNELLNAFIRGEVAAEGEYEGKHSFMISDLLNNDEEWLKYSVGDWIDADNDGEDELVMDGPYGGMILDARNGKVVILAQGEGTAGVLRIAQAPGGYWIAHCDTSHGGREVYSLDLYNGDGDIISSEVLSAEYYDSPDGQYNQKSSFTYRDKPISMQEFEDIRWELFESWNEKISDNQ